MLVAWIRHDRDGENRNCVLNAFSGDAGEGFFIRFYEGRIKMLTIGFIGAGTVGTALAQLLNSKGYQIVAVSSRSLTSANNLAQVVGGCHLKGLANSSRSTR